MNRFFITFLPQVAEKKVLQLTDVVTDWLL